MKKRFIYLISLSIILLLGLLGYYELFGHVKSNKIIINNFSKIRNDILVPEKKGAYSTHYVELKGYVNDSVKISLDGGFPYTIQGKVDTVFSNIDYYGTNDAILKIESNKKTNGKLKIKHIIK